MNFIEVLHECANNQEFVENFDRLRGTNLSRRGAPIGLAIDAATGRMESDTELFYDFVLEYVWLPIAQQ